jgi:ABC-2 type transport system ATP-binding protein
MAASIIGLIKRYGDLTAVDGISFTVAPATIFGLLGPNGDGKTTTVEILEGLRNADAGDVRVLGLDVRTQRDELKQRIGVQLQTPALFPRLSVTEILELFARFFRRSVAVEGLIDALGLQESRAKLVKQLSGGQQQRLSVALALVNDPEVIFLDEPTTGLDPQARLNLWELVRGLRNRGKTIILTTHYMEEAERLCDQVAIIDHGRIVALNSPSALIRDNFNESAILFKTADIDTDELRRLPAVSDIAEDDQAYTLYSHDAAVTLSGLLAYAERGGRILEGLSLRGASLEDVFLKLTGKRLRD